MLPLTIGILAKNEAEEMPACLAQCSFASEVVVLVDTSSTDQTYSIAQTAGARVYRAKLESFADARNYILDQAKQDWVLFLDADERLTPELIASIGQLIAQPEQYVGAELLRQDIFLGRRLRHGDANSWLLRLGKRASGSWQRPVHEIWSIDGPIIRLKGVLDHYAHKDVAEYLRKMEFYTDLDAIRSSEQSSWWQLPVYPVLKFLKVYIFQLGLLDGWAGFVFAYLNARYSFVKRKKLLRSVRSAS